MQQIIRYVAAAVAIAAVVAGVQVYRQQATVEGLREALDASRAAYDGLAADYDEAVRRSAVTELVVADGRLAVVVKTAFGDVERIDTPLDPRREIYVDYVVLDGRLWVRRVFDDLTPPGQSVVIESRFGAIDWDSQAEADHGKAVYRKLTDGRWAITVTGNGALGLEKVSDDATVELVELPAAVRRFEVLGGE
ncbi:MAG: hypothetical protein AAF823_15180 [Planctomycetota bacterium]